MILQSKHSRRFISWMALSIAIHGMVSLWPRAAADKRPIIDNRTLWISEWQAHIPETTSTKFLRHDSSAEENTPHTIHDQSRAATSSREMSSAQDTKQSVEKTAEFSESEIANHMLGLINRHIKEHFVYPPFARREGWEGEVVVALQLNSKGEIRDICVIQSSGFRVLDEDALLIMRKIGSIPDARLWLNGSSYRARVPVTYRLTS